MEDNREQFKGISVQLVDFDRKLDSHTEMIGTPVEDIAVLKKDIFIIKGDVKQKADRKEITVLERRVSVVEAKVR